jgi:hypothetical protein
MQRKDIIGVGLIVAVLMAITSLLVLSQNGNGDRPLDKATGCLQDTTSNATIIIVDQTDPISESQKAQIEQRLDQIISNVDEFDRIILQPIDMNLGAGLPGFDQCSPSNGDDANEWTSNPALIKRRYEKRFLKPFRAALREFTSPTTLDMSPIIESIQTVVKNAEYENYCRVKRIVLVSDMLQNSKHYSHYKSGFDFLHYKSADYSINLKDVAVEVLYLWRPYLSAQEAEDHKKFWTSFFSYHNSGSWDGLKLIK